MIEKDAISPDMPYATFLAAIVLVAAHVSGWIVLWLSGVFRKPQTLLILTLPLGLLILVGLVSTGFLGRLCHLSMLLILPFGLAVAARLLGARKDNASIERVRCGMQDAGGLCLAFFLSCAFSWWLYVWHWPDGSLTLPYNDLGYFSMVVKELPASGMMSLWSGTLGEHSRAAGATDVWYHWGPLWLGCAVSRLAGVSPLVAMIHIVVPALTFMVVFGAGTIVSLLAERRIGLGMCLGALSLIAIPLPVVGASTIMMKLIPGGITQHLHLSMAYRYCFTYRLEAFVVQAVIACWLLGLRPLAILFLFLAGVSAPHSVAGLGVAAGVYAGIALLRRSRRDFVLALGLIVALLSAWIAVGLLFGVGLPKTGEAKILVLDPGFLWREGAAFVRSLGIGIVIALPALAGALCLIRSDHVAGKEAQASELGWFALSALIGSYAAYHLLLPDGERNHFVGYAHAVLIFPIGTWGLIVATRSASAWKRKSAVILLSLMGTFGVCDSWTDWRMVTSHREKFTAQDLKAIKSVIGEEKFGYFAASDRPWWIPDHASLSAVLGASCTRLNIIPEIDEASAHARFYGSNMPRMLVPKRVGESENSWALRFARALGIRFVIETEQHAIPDEVKVKATPTVRVPGLRLYELER